MAIHSMWETVDFRPAPAGWQLAFLPDDPDNPLILKPMPGWLIEEETLFNDVTGRDEPRTGRTPRRAIAAMVVPGQELHPATDHQNFWMEIGPGQVFSVDEIRNAVEERMEDDA